MKKLILLITLVSITSLSIAQQENEKYKDFTACAECFDGWTDTQTQISTTPSKSKSPKSSTDAYGVHAPSYSEKRDSFARQETRRFIGGIVAVFATVATLVIYNKVNKAANEIQ